MQVSMLLTSIDNIFQHSKKPFWFMNNKLRALIHCVSKQSIGSLPSNYFLAKIVKLVCKYVPVYVIWLSINFTDTQHCDKCCDGTYWTDIISTIVCLDVQMYMKRHNSSFDPAISKTSHLSCIIKISHCATLPEWALLCQALLRCIWTK